MQPDPISPTDHAGPGHNLKRPLFNWRRRLWTVLQAALAGCFGYAAAGVALAFVVVQCFPTRHPHAMDEMLYFIFPMLLAPAGAVCGVAVALLAKTEDFWKTVKILSCILGGLIVLAILTNLFF